MPPSPTEAKPRAADQLIAAFEERILAGELAPGDPLPPEREIVQEHGVSRTVVREALRVLSSRGLIDARPGYRPVVARPGYDAAIDVVGSLMTQMLGKTGGVRNLFDLRIRMEVSLVRDAALTADSKSIERLETALEDNRRAIEDSELFYQTDTAFHGIFYEVTGNPILPAIHRAYTDWLSVQWKQMPRLPDRNRSNYEAHKAVFDAILRRDPDRAEQALRYHLDAAWQQVSTTFEGL